MKNYNSTISKFESKQTIQNPDVAAVMYTMLLVDMSGSITEANQADALVDAAKSFAQKVGKSQKVGVYAFDGSTHLTPVAPFGVKSTTMGVPCTSTWSGNGSPAGGAASSHFTTGAKLPTGVRCTHAGSNRPVRGGEPHGTQPVPGTQYVSSRQSSSFAQLVCATHWPWEHTRPEGQPPGHAPASDEADASSEKGASAPAAMQTAWRRPTRAPGGLLPLFLIGAGGSSGQLDWPAQHNVTARTNSIS